jgi:hypothetical protein
MNRRVAADAGTYKVPPHCHGALADFFFLGKPDKPRNYPAYFRVNSAAYTFFLFFFISFFF